METSDKSLKFYQLFEPKTSTYTYLLADSETNEAVIIDPVQETFDRDAQIIEELGLKLLYVLDTHIHADHITSASRLRDKFAAKTAVSDGAGVSCANISLSDGDELSFGKHTIRTITTPGHTDSCVSYHIGGMVFTGDTLLIRGCGRTDFQQGDSEKLYKSVHEKLFKLDPKTSVYPGHDYKGRTRSTIEEEIKFNPRLGQGNTLDEFKKIMSELNLPEPKQIETAVPANLVCGQISKGSVTQFELVDGVPTVSPDHLSTNLKMARLIDVRRPDEFTGELKHIPGAELITLGEDFEKWISAADKSEPVIFVCRSGGRSGSATAFAKENGFESVYNLEGGMILWNQRGYETE